MCMLSLLSPSYSTWRSIGLGGPWISSMIVDNWFYNFSYFLNKLDVASHKYLNGKSLLHSILKLWYLVYRSSHEEIDSFCTSCSSLFPLCLVENSLVSYSYWIILWDISCNPLSMLWTKILNSSFSSMFDMFLSPWI